MWPLVFPFGTRRPASDTDGKAIVRQALQPGAFRDRLTRDIFCLRRSCRSRGAARIYAEESDRERRGRQEARARHPQGRGQALSQQRLDRRGQVEGRADRGRSVSPWPSFAISWRASSPSMISMRRRLPRAQPPAPKPRRSSRAGAARASRAHCRRVELIMATTLPNLQDWRFTDRFRGHRLGGHRPQGREHELARPPPDRGARRDRQGGRGGVRERRGQGPRHHERQGPELHRRRRHPRVRELRHRGPRSRRWSGRRSSCSTASSGFPSPWSPRSTAIASAAASNWRSPATGASPIARRGRGSASPRSSSASSRG